MEHNSVRFPVSHVSCKLKRDGETALFFSNSHLRPAVHVYHHVSRSLLFSINQSWQQSPRGRCIMPRGFVLCENMVEGSDSAPEMFQPSKAENRVRTLLV